MYQHLHAFTCLQMLLPVWVATVYIVAFVAQKGGVGKTTLTVSLATLADAEGHAVAVIDCDSSGSATEWQQNRAKQQGKTSPPVAWVGESKTLRAAVAAARGDGIEWLFIDTGAGVTELAALAAELADLVLIPCTPLPLDMKGMRPTAKLVRRLGRPAFFVINKGRSSGALNNACAVALSSVYGLPAAAAHIQLRMPIADIVDAGSTLPESVGRDPSTLKGQDELRALWRWVGEQSGQHVLPAGDGVGSSNAGAHAHG